MKDIQQLIKKNSQEGRYEDIFPKTFIDAISDKESGVTLTDILAMFNMLFLSYNGSRSQTRLQVPSSLRRQGLWVTYVLYDKTVVTEWYSAEAIDDTTFGDSANWRDGSNALVGDISISSNGTWVINGVDSGLLARGEKGDNPILKVSEDGSTIQYSYNCVKWYDLLKVSNITPKINISEPTELAPGSTPTVENTGNDFNVELQFGLPKSPEVNIGSTTTIGEGNQAKVTNSGTKYAPVLNFQIPKGDTGSGIKILGFYDTLENLKLKVTAPKISDVYCVGTAEPYHLYVWTNIYNPDTQETAPGWKDSGTMNKDTTIIVNDLGDREDVAMSQKGIKKLIRDYNVSYMYPSDGIDGTYKYDIETAVKVLSSKNINKNLGCTLTFIDVNKVVKSYLYSGASFESVNSWIKQGVGIKEFIINGYIDYNGNHVDNITFRCTGFLRVGRNSIIDSYVSFGPSVCGCVFYDKDKKHIGNFSVENNGEQSIVTSIENPIPSEAVYVRLCVLALYAEYSYVNITINNDDYLQIINENLTIDYKKGIAIQKDSGLEITAEGSAISASNFIPIGNDFDIIANCGGNTRYCLYALYDKFFNCLYTENVVGDTSKMERITKSIIESKTPNASFIRINLVSSSAKNDFPYIVGYTDGNILALSSIHNVNFLLGNFFNKQGYILYNNGDSIFSNDYNCTDFIKIDKGSDIVVRGYKGPSVSICSFYDANKNFISSYNTEKLDISTVYINKNEIPENAEYVRCSKSSMHDGFFFNGNCTLNSLIEKVDKNSFTIKNIIGNLFINKDCGINKITGDTFFIKGYNCTDFIKINRLDNIYIGGSEGKTALSICSFYNRNKHYISSYEGVVYGDKTIIIEPKNIPIEAYYIRCSCSATKESYVFNTALTVSSILQKDINKDKLVKAAAWVSKGQIREEYLRQKYIDSGEKAKWYGIEWKEEFNPDNVVAINSEGDDELHTTLPIQNKIRRCITKHGVVQYYLNSDNSELKEDGTPAKLDGTDGNVMVEIPEFFFRCEDEIIDGVRTCRLKISEQGLPNFKFSRKRYTSAYEATVDRTANKLVSVCTTLFTRKEEIISIEAENKYIVGDGFSLGLQKTALRNGFTDNAANYRGGTNDSSLDNETDISSQNYSRNQLGIPVSNVNRNDCRRLADTDNDEFMDLYDTQKTLWILAQVEYKTRNIQKGIVDGGLGKGATVYPDYAAYEKYFSPQRGIACIPCGVSNVLGNKSGEVYYKMINVPVESTGSGSAAIYTKWSDVWMPVMSYRGVENFYGHIYKIVDQINLICKDTGTYIDGHDGDTNWVISDHSYYYESNPYLSDNNIDDKKHLGTYRFSSSIMCVKSLMLGEDAHILHIDTLDKNYATLYCDCSELLTSDDVLYITFNGRIVSGELVGFHFIVGADKVNGSTKRPSDGTRLNHF